MNKMVQDWVEDWSTTCNSTVSKIWKFQNCDKHISKNWIIGTYSRLWPKCLRDYVFRRIHPIRILEYWVGVFTTCILKLHNWGHTNVLWCIGHVSFFVSFLSFPLAFSINSCGKWLNTIIMTTQPTRDQAQGPHLQTSVTYIHFEILFCLLLYTVLDQLERGLLRIFKLYIQCQIQSSTPTSKWPRPRGVINGKGRQGSCLT